MNHTPRRAVWAMVAQPLGLGFRSPRPDHSMRFDDPIIVSAFEPLRKKFGKVAFRPIIRDIRTGNSLTQFGGPPLVSPTDPWPRCGICRQQIPLLLQIDIDHTPAMSSIFGDRQLLQVFMCQRNDRSRLFCSSWKPFQPNQNVRLIKRDNLEIGDQHDLDAKHPVAFVANWEIFDDYPDEQEHRSLGVRYEYHFEDSDNPPDVGHVNVFCDWLKVEFLNVENGYERGREICDSVASASSGDKLFGWPYWVQFTSYPQCDLCGCPMRYLLQIDSECSIPIIFGDVGTAHVFYCDEHRSNLAITYECS